MLEELVTGELFSSYPHNKSRKKKKKQQRHFDCEQWRQRVTSSLE